MSSALCIAGQRIAGQRTVELAVPDAVEKALPLVPVVDQDPPRWVASHAHQHPVRTGGVRLLTRPRVAVPPDHGNLDSAVPVTRAAPERAPSSPCGACVIVPPSLPSVFSLARYV